VAATEDPSSQPWPHWVMRYIGANNQQAYWDAITSVGGSPPWGGIGYDEAGAVYNLLEQYMGPSTASDSAYDAVAAYLAGRPDDVLALEAFRIHDRIASNPEAFMEEDVAAGMELARQLNHPGVACYFALLQSQLFYQRNDVKAAKEQLFEVLQPFIMLAMIDPVYIEQVLKAAQNAASFAVMDGDIENARIAAMILRELGAEDRLGDLRDRLL
jgi:hypothetical protein